MRRAEECGAGSPWPDIAAKSLRTANVTGPTYSVHGIQEDNDDNDDGIMVATKIVMLSVIVLIARRFETIACVTA